MKKTVIMANILSLIFMVLPVFADEQLKVEDLMSHSEFKGAGLGRQTPDEISVLNAWLNRFIATRLESVNSRGNDKKTSRGLLAIFSNPEGISYKIVKIENKKFNINKREYEMIRSCEGFKEGDEVKFIKGSAHGFCETATFVHTESDARCEVWCDNY